MPCLPGRAARRRQPSAEGSAEGRIDVMSCDVLRCLIQPCLMLRLAAVIFLFAYYVAIQTEFECTIIVTEIEYA
jgi:hypothetical protein